MERKNRLDLSFSLLWPFADESGIELGEQTICDLGTDKLVKTLVLDERRQQAVLKIFAELSVNPDTLNFRLDIIDDLLRQKALIRCFEDLQPVLSELQYYVFRPEREDWTPLQEVVWRLRELEHYVASVCLLQAAFEGIEPLHSEGLRRLKEHVLKISSDTVFIKLQAALPELLAKIGRIKSISIGVNLDPGLVPAEATLLSINSNVYQGDSLYSRMIGQADRGIAPLHSSKVSSYYANPLMIPLFQDISNILDKATKPLAVALKQFAGINSKLFVKLHDDLLFYLGAVKMIQRLRDAGLAMIRPHLLVQEERCFQAKGLYNINLALHTWNKTADRQDLSGTIVDNDLTQGQDGRIVILTGPNRGGKTTFLQAVGLTQVLAQAGLYVPAKELRVSLTDGIFTHYPAQEVPEKGTGRFGEEAERLKQIFHTATRHSLVLLNESLSTTSMGEGLYLAQDLLRVLRMMGCRVIFTTHIHQLAAEVTQINEDTPGDAALISLVATIDEQAPGNEHRFIPTFRIIPGPPAGQSYALELASRLGISREQLLANLKQRDCL